MSSLTATQLQQQYIAYFGRPGDPEGLNYWSSDATDITSAAEFADKIYAQPEYQTTTIASKTTSEQVNQLYLNLFNRSADTAGLIYWTTEIEKGTLSLSNLAYDLIYAASNPLADNKGQAALDAANLNAKVEAAEAYTEAIAGDVNALLAYKPGAAYESAVSFISSVSFNEAVDQAVITTPAGLAPLTSTNINVFVAQMMNAADDITGMMKLRSNQDSSQDIIYEEDQTIETNYQSKNIGLDNNNNFMIMTEYDPIPSTESYLAGGHISELNNGLNTHLGLSESSESFNILPQITEL